MDRTEHLDSLDVLLEAAEGSVPIATLTGAPGVGKSALALHWAHRVRPRFTDGDLYVNLHGHTPGPRAEAVQALGVLLRALSVPPERVPVDLDGRSALYRSLLDGKRVLVVIDDALSAEQIRPLIPASSGSMVVVTSRNTLAGLVARDGARRFSLGVLPKDDSVSLLREALGTRVDSEPEEAHRLAGHCAHLPLALRVAVERLVDRPGASLGDLVRELAAEESRLDALSEEEDELSDLRAVMTASYRTLTPDSARFLRMLGLHPGAEFSSASAAALTETTPTEARRLLDRLTRSNLVERMHQDRYRLHDLVRLFAVERAREEVPGMVEPAVRRVARWYLRAAARAQLAEHPHFPTVEGDPEDAPIPEFATARDALEWFERERANLLAAQHAAFDHGDHDTAWRLAASVYPLFEVHRHWHEWRDMHRLGIRAAERADDAFGLARNHLGLGDAEWLLGDLDAAVNAYHSALEANAAAGDLWVEGFARRQLGVVAWQRGERDGSAVVHARRALEVFREAGERRGEAMALLSLADFAVDSNDVAEARTDCQAAIDVFTDIGAVWSVAWAQCTLGRILTGSGRAGDAVGVYETAVTVFEDHGDDDSLAVARTGLADALVGLGDTIRASATLRAVLDHFRDHSDHRSADVEARLHAIATDS